MYSKLQFHVNHTTNLHSPSIPLGQGFLLNFDPTQGFGRFGFCKHGKNSNPVDHLLGYQNGLIQPQLTIMNMDQDDNPFTFEILWKPQGTIQSFCLHNFGLILQYSILVEFSISFSQLKMTYFTNFVGVAISYIINHQHIGRDLRQGTIWVHFVTNFMNGPDLWWFTCLVVDQLNIFYFLPFHLLNR